MKLVSLIFILFLSQNTYTQTGTIIIKITNVKEIKGKINIGIYNNEKDFPLVNKEYKTLSLNVTGSSIQYTIDNIPRGVYAIAVFHDKNSDGICNRNFLGFPTEAYGFSNNIKPVFSSPSFEKTKFKVENTVKITISLIN